MTVYVSSIWWTDCDPFLRIVGNDMDTVRHAAIQSMKDAVLEAEDSDNEDTSLENEIHWNGVGAMSLTDMVAAYEIPGLEPDYSRILSGDKEALLYLTD